MAGATASRAQIVRSVWTGRALFGAQRSRADDRDCQTVPFVSGLQSRGDGRELFARVIWEWPLGKSRGFKPSAERRPGLRSRDFCSRPPFLYTGAHFQAAGFPAPAVVPKPEPTFRAAGFPAACRHPETGAALSGGRISSRLSSSPKPPVPTFGRQAFQPPVVIRKPDRHLRAAGFPAACPPSLPKPRCPLSGGRPLFLQHFLDHGGPAA